MLTLTLLGDITRAATPPVSWLSLLSERLALPRETTLAAVADLLATPLMEAAAIRMLTPAFEHASYGDMVARHLLVGSDEQGHLIAVLGMPLDADVGGWLAQFPLREIYFGDAVAIHAKLESHEGMFSAVADAVGVETVAELTRDDSGDLTLTSIQGEASPAVRLINSTVF